MRYFFALLVFCVAACRPAGQQVIQPDSAMLYVRTDVNGDCRICRRPESNFRHAFDKFYLDDSDKFYIRTFLLRSDSSGKLIESDVMVNLPRLDSATLHSDGLYLIDKNRVICVFGNSDGGNFVELKGVDPGTFKSFRNVFGGKDRDHVFSRDIMLEGLSPQRVKVYSNMKNCGNCDGYFKDGVLMEFMGEKVAGSKIPKDYVFVE